MISCLAQRSIHLQYPDCDHDDRGRNVDSLGVSCKPQDDSDTKRLELHVTQEERISVLGADVAKYGIQERGVYYFEQFNYRNGDRQLLADEARHRLGQGRGGCMEVAQKPSSRKMSRWKLIYVRAYIESANPEGSCCLSVPGTPCLYHHVVVHFHRRFRRRLQPHANLAPRQ